MVVAAENNPLWVGVGVPRGRAPFPCSFSLFIHPTICLELAEIQILFWAKPMELSLLLTFKHKRWLPQSWRFPHLEKGVQSMCTFFFGMKEVGGVRIPGRYSDQPSRFAYQCPSFKTGNLSSQETSLSWANIGTWSSFQGDSAALASHFSLVFVTLEEVKEPKACGCHLQSPQYDLLSEFWEHLQLQGR